MRNFFAWLFLFCVISAIGGLVWMALPDAPPRIVTDSDEIARLKQEIRHKDAIIERQRDIIASRREKPEAGSQKPE